MKESITKFLPRPHRELKKRQNIILVSEKALDYKFHQLAVNDKIKNIKKDYGIFFTPEWVVDFMVGLINFNKYKTQKIYIAEPACGLAQFLVGIKRKHPHIYERSYLVGIELNREIINYLKKIGIHNEIKLINEDYLLWEPKHQFDVIIGNPPYGIPSLSEHYTIKISPETKERYKNLFETWYGKYNIYGAFIEKSIKLLKTGGQLILIVPSTFMILDEFKKLRQFLSQNGGTAIIYLGSDVFKPEADVSSVVLNFLKSPQFVNRFELFEYRDNRIKFVKADQNWQGEIITFETNFSKNLERYSSYKLGEVYEIKISPRTPEIKNNSFILKSDIGECLPILNGRNLRCKEVIYKNFTGYWIKKEDVKKIRNFFNLPHIVVGLGFRENGKVAAAYDEKSYPWMGDVYHLLRKNNLLNLKFDMSDQEVIEYLSSEYVRNYIKDVYRDITYHLNITQLKNIPLPNKKEWERIKREILL